MEDKRRYFSDDELGNALGKIIKCVRAHTKGYDQAFVKTGTEGAVNFDFDEEAPLEGPYTKIQVCIEWNGAGPIGYSKDEFDSFCEIIGDVP